jgi:hypothetical protein
MALSVKGKSFRVYKYRGRPDGRIRPDRSSGGYGSQVGVPITILSLVVSVALLPVLWPPSL